MSQRYYFYLALCFTKQTVCQSQCLCVMIFNTNLSVSFIPTEPIWVRVRMLRSTLSSMIPSTEVTHLCSIAKIADNTAVDTPLVSFSAQLGLAPSQIIPVRLAIMF